MRKLIITLFAATAIIFAASSQNYKAGFGAAVDVGEGGTYFGPHAKYFFTPEIAGQAMVLFGPGSTAIGLEGSYNRQVPGVPGLSWNIGVGPQALIGNVATWFLLRPSAGVEFTVPKSPINMGFDWRPSLIFVNRNNHFVAGRFGIFLRYTL